jgi:amidohydrolase
MRKLALCLFFTSAAFAQTWDKQVDAAAAAVEEKVIRWRRDIHQNPELSNQEVRTAKVAADHLRALGIEVKTGVGGTGVVGVLRGGKPGPVVALRADMDALPVTEQVDVPFASKVRTVFNGQEVGVMHACGHDAHVAMLMGVAEMLAGMKSQIPGTVKFIFQPAEEGEGGAENMIRDGVMENPKPDAIFGLHVMSSAEVGEIQTRPGAFMAAADQLTIKIRGKQTHGAYPWRGVDPIVIGSQIVLALQTIPSRQLDVSLAPSIVTIGAFRGGVRNNIIPDEVEMIGTLRSLDETMRQDLHARVKRTAELIAQSGGATATVEIKATGRVTYNDPALTEKTLPTLRRVAGGNKVAIVSPGLVAEDFSAYQAIVPGVFFYVGIRPKGVAPAEAAANHSPLFFVDESGLRLGLRAMATTALDYLSR